MPTPNDEILHELCPTAHPDHRPSHSQSHPSCPPDDRRVNMRRTHDAIAARTTPPARDPVPQQQPTPPADADTDTDITGTSTNIDLQDSEPKTMDAEEENAAGEVLSPMSTVSDGKEADQRLSSYTLPSSAVGQRSSSSSSRAYEFSNVRIRPTSCSSFLRPGSKFHGTQQSDRQVYDVEVELKNVDMDQSFLCGYLRIQGLTDDHPTLTTYFEGEIVGDKYSFRTNHPEWGSNDTVDMQHWARFHAWRPLAKSARKPDFTYKNFMQRENIFMRWKEYFLVPDHRVRTISGASFEGFYFICFNQVSGNVSGIYFHAKNISNLN
ncbi:MAG: hypothetical protein M1833_007109 [Piccolia ochrophora]|nr:MAG: hypothetical protein M1833_007109 [Piccolia ochrophora]